MIVCIQCSMRAMIEDRPYKGDPDATPEQHMARVHPDPIATATERKELERLLVEKMKHLKRQG